MSRAPCQSPSPVKWKHVPSPPCQMAPAHKTHFSLIKKLFCCTYDDVERCPMRCGTCLMCVGRCRCPTQKPVAIYGPDGPLAYPEHENIAILESFLAADFSPPYMHVRAKYGTLPFDTYEWP